MAATTGETTADPFPGRRVTRGEQAGHRSRAVVVDDIDATGAAQRALGEQVDLETVGERVDTAPIELQEEVRLP